MAGRINVDQVPESRHTLFIRGFEGSLELDVIRDFFTREGGKCKFDFFKQSADRRQLFVALRFESRHVARDIKDRYDGREVLGSRVEITFFKDIRKYAALAKEGAPLPATRRDNRSSFDHRPLRVPRIPITNPHYRGERSPRSPVVGGSGSRVARSRVQCSRSPFSSSPNNVGHRSTSPSRGHPQKSRSRSVSRLSSKSRSMSLSSDSSAATSPKTSPRASPRTNTVRSTLKRRKSCSLGSGGGHRSASGGAGGLTSPNCNDHFESIRSPSPQFIEEIPPPLQKCKGPRTPSPIPDPDEIPLPPPTQGNAETTKNGGVGVSIDEIQLPSGNPRISVTLNRTGGRLVSASMRKSFDSPPTFALTASSAGSPQKSASVLNKKGFASLLATAKKKKESTEHLADEGNARSDSVSTTVENNNKVQTGAEAENARKSSNTSTEAANNSKQQQKEAETNKQQSQTSKEKCANSTSLNLNKPLSESQQQPEKNTSSASISTSVVLNNKSNVYKDKSAVGKIKEKPTDKSTAAVNIKEKPDDKSAAAVNIKEKPTDKVKSTSDQAVLENIDKSTASVAVNSKDKPPSDLTTTKSSNKSSSRKEKEKRPVQELPHKKSSSKTSISNEKDPQTSSRDDVTINDQSKTCANLNSNSKQEQTTAAPPCDADVTSPSAVVKVIAADTSRVSNSSKETERTSHSRAADLSGPIRTDAREADAQLRQSIAGTTASSVADAISSSGPVHLEKREHRKRMRNNNDGDDKSATKKSKDNEPEILSSESGKLGSGSDLVLSSTARKACEVHVERDRDFLVANLPVEKQAQIKAKREEIDESFRSDCETFLLVVRMLLSKNPSVEDNLIESYRECLKDISGRYLEEFNVFVDTLLGQRPQKNAASTDSDETSRTSP